MGDRANYPISDENRAAMLLGEIAANDTQREKRAVIVRAFEEIRAGGRSETAGNEDADLRRARTFVEMEEIRAGGRSETAGNAAQACKHVDPLVLDGQRAWCWDCGALYGMSKWRLPKHGYSESELECAREAGRIEERAACLAIAEGFRQQYRSLRNQPDDPFQMNGWDAKAYAAWRIALRIEQRCGEAKTSAGPGERPADATQPMEDSMRATGEKPDLVEATRRVAGRATVADTLPKEDR